MLPEKELMALSVKTESKIVLLIMDGVGGLPVNGKTELATAKKPNLGSGGDRLRTDQP